MRVFNPYAEAILAATIWSLASVAVKWLQMPPETLAFFRTAIPTLFLGAYFWYSSINPFHGNLKAMAMASLMNAARFYCFMVAFTYADISDAIILLFSWPAFAALYAWVFLKEKISSKKLGLMVMAFSGMAFIYANPHMSFSSREMIGLLAITLHSAIYAGTVVIFKNEIHNYSRWEVVFYQNILGALIFLPFIFLHPMPETWQLVVAPLYAFVAGIVGFGLFFSALKRLDTATVSVLAYFEAVGAVALGVLLFNEVLTWNMLVGAAMILSATYILTRYKDKL
jgi:drug/metabolite transporter (DMT)-like permease